MSYPKPASITRDALSAAAAAGVSLAMEDRTLSFAVVAYEPEPFRPITIGIIAEPDPIPWVLAGPTIAG
jgi:hypothetical protein